MEIFHGNYTTNAFEYTLLNNWELIIAMKAPLCYCNQMPPIMNWDLHYLDFDLYEILNQMMSQYLGRPGTQNMCIMCVHCEKTFE